MKRFLLIFILISIISGLEAFASEDSGQAGYRGTILRVSSDEKRDSLIESGVIILRQRSDLVLALIPRKTKAKKIKGKGGVLPGFERKNIPTLDKAAERFGGREVHNGSAGRMPYTGKGVVVGFCDIGFDPSHPAFLDAGGKELRVKRMIRYKESAGIRIVADSPEDILAMGVDTVSEWHATHVGGILAGQAFGTPYLGAAPDAEIVATTSELSDAGLLAGVEDILDYAREVGKPAVVNLSMGSYLGPHDGTSLFSQYLDMLGEEAIICLSSGNEGGQSNTLQYTFSDSSRKVGYQLANYKWTNFDMYGMTDIWSADDTPLKVTLYVGDGSKPAIKIADINLEKNGYACISSEEGEFYSEEFAKYFTGNIQIGEEINADNGRYNLAFLYDFDTEEVSSHGPWARYVLQVELTGTPGQHVDIYADGSYTFLGRAPGSPKPGADASVSDLCTGHNVISVGMYNNRETVPTLSGEGRENGYLLDEMCKHSGYGTLVDGRVLPLTVGPGATIIAPINSAYVAADPDMIPDLCDARTSGGKTYYWNDMGGTSMSSPFVAGYIACWLEANPSLTIADVQDILKATNVTSGLPEPENPRHGQGWFNPLAGLEMAMKKGAASGTLSEDSLRILPEGERIVVYGLADCGILSLYNVDGSCAAEYRVSPEASSADISALPSGVYVARLISDGQTVCRKILH